jgi:hypothetical protein
VLLDIVKHFTRYGNRTFYLHITAVRGISFRALSPFLFV